MVHTLRIGASSLALGFCILAAGCNCMPGVNCVDLQPLAVTYADTCQEVCYRSLPCHGYSPTVWYEWPEYCPPNDTLLAEPDTMLDAPQPLPDTHAAPEPLPPQAPSSPPTDPRGPPPVLIDEPPMENSQEPLPPVPPAAALFQP